jgi:acyl carrier protein
VDETLATVRRIFRNTFNCDPEQIDLDTKPEQVKGWDSLGHVTLASNLEEAFGLSFEVDDLMEMEDVDAIVRIVRRKLNR